MKSILSFVSTLLVGGGLTGLFALLQSRGSDRARREEIYADHIEELFKELRETRQEREKLAQDNFELRQKVSDLEHQVSSLEKVISTLNHKIDILNAKVPGGVKIEDY